MNIIADYSPLISLNLTNYRFTRQQTTQTNTTSVDSSYVSFNPYYTIVNIISISNNVTSGSLRPGEVGHYIFRAVNESNTNMGFANVPFNFSIVLGQLTPGVHVFTTNAGNITNSTGYIDLYFYSTYLVTPETATFPIRINIIADIGLFNRTYQSDPNFYIGTQPMNKASYNDYVDTWSYNNNTYFIIQPNYLYAMVNYTTIPDSQVLNTTTNEVRPNNETITIRFQVYFTNVTPNSNFKFPVNITLIGLYYGVTYSIKNSANNPYYNYGYYYTNTAGYIDFNLTLASQTGWPTTQLINISATVDFGNDTCSGCSNSELSRWNVGGTTVAGFNTSQESFYTTPSTSYLIIHETPAYVTGIISAGNAFNITSGNPLNIIPFTYVNIPFTVSVQSSTYASEDGIAGAKLSGIKVYLNETILELYKIYLIRSIGLITNSTGQVTFTIYLDNNSFNGVARSFQIPAYADFQNDQGVSSSLANKTGTFNYQWLNGSIGTTGYVNVTAGKTINNYSTINSTSIHLYFAQIMYVNINRIFNKTGGLVSGDTTQILRGYTLELSIHYLDSNGNGVKGTVKLTTQVVSPSGQLTNITLNNFATITNTNGIVVQNLTTSNAYYVGDAGIIAENQNLPANQPFVASPKNFTIMAKLSFLTAPTVGIPHGSNEVFVGENLTVSGALRDELGPINSSSYSSSVINQLISGLQITGLDSSNTTLIGLNVTGSFTFTSTQIIFSYNWTVPSNYNNNRLNLLIQIPDLLNTIYFVKSNSSLFATVGGLPEFYANYINVFQNVSFIFSLSKTNTTMIDYTGSVNIDGVLHDNYGNPLTNRFIQIYNSTQILTVETNTSGGFHYYNFISQYNRNITNLLQIKYLSPVDSSLVNINYFSLVRTLYDVYAPTIVFNNANNQTYVYQNLNLNLTITDPQYVKNNYVPWSGIDNASATLKENGIVIWNNINDVNWNGNNPLLIPYDILSFINNNPSASSVTLTFIIEDNGHNIATITIIYLIDRIAPTIVNIAPNGTQAYAYQDNYIFSFNATDAQSGLNYTTATMYFISGFNSTYPINSQLTLQYNSTTGTFDSGYFNFSHLQNNIFINFTIYDNAGNRGFTSTLEIVADLIATTITLTNPTTNNFDVLNQNITFTFQASDTQTGINPNSLVLYNANNIPVLTRSNFAITHSGSTYTITGHLSRNQLNLLVSQQSFSFNVTDNNGNTNTFNLLFKIDIVGPSVSKSQVYQPDLNTTVDTSKTNLTTSWQYISFSLNDAGTPMSGVNTSYIQILLSVNSTMNITLTISNGQLTVSNSSFKNDFNFTISNGVVLIGWNASNLGNYGFPQTRNTQIISVQWTVTALYDNFGNALQPNTLNSRKYFVIIEALPPPPNIFVEIASYGFIFFVFIGLGVGIAFVFEKIRYVG